MTTTTTFLVRCWLMVAALAGSGYLLGQTPIQDQWYLWPGTAPGSEAVSVTEEITDRNPNGPCYLNRSVRKVTEPSLKAFVPANPNGRAVLLCPGGGYALLAYDKEGYDIAQWYNERDITAFVLKYRLPIDGHDQRQYVPLQDAQRAMRLLRAKADSLGIHPDSIGVMGGSAGGHVAASLSVFYDWEVYAPVDSVDSLSAKPAFSVLMYPVISFQDSLTHGGSRDNLLGTPITQAQKDSFSTERHVDAETPSAFLFHARGDGSVSYRNSAAYARALDSAGVAHSLNLYNSSGHGQGKCEAGNTEFARWPRDLDAWLTQEGWTTPCLGTELTITKSDTNPNLLIASPAPSYQWYRNGLPLNGQTDSTYLVQADAQYSVSTDGQRAGSQSPCVIYSEEMFVTRTVGIAPKQTPDLQIYPNPVGEQLWLEGWPHGSAQLVYQVWDQRGALVDEGQLAIEAGRGELKVGALVPGLYLLRVIADGEVYGQRFRKQ